LAPQNVQEGFDLYRGQSLDILLPSAFGFRPAGRSRSASRRTRSLSAWLWLRKTS
jgi:hypothetical protein